MRKVFLILCALSLATGCSRNEKDDSTNQIEDPATRKNNEYLKKGGWRMVWNDEFNRNDIFMTGIWSKIWGCPTSTADWCKTMSHDPSLFEIKDGNLILLGKPSPDSNKNNPKYITGGVSTKDKKYFQNGRLEIRCKLEATQGAWPAIWMVPDAPWPTGGEIDIVERLNYEAFVHHTVHSTYTQAGKKDTSKRSPKSTATAPINPNDYNIYAVELDTNEVRFYVNGEQTFSYAHIPGKENEGQFPFNRPYMLRIDMQLGGKWVGEVKPFTKPVRMYVDWVRFYQK